MIASNGVFGRFFLSIIATGVIKRVVERAIKPRFTIDIKESPVFRGYPHPVTITRLAWSKDNMFLAALALSGDTAYITVWDMNHWDPSKHQDPSDFPVFLSNTTAAIARFNGQESLRNLSIGLAISPNGRHVAVFQEPRIGQWAEGSGLDECMFQFRLLTPTPAQDVANVASVRNVANVATVGNADNAANANVAATLSDATDFSVNMEPNEPRAWTFPLLAGDGNQASQQEEPSRLPHSKLRDFMGYSAYSSRSCDMSGSTNAHPAHEDSETRSCNCNTQSTTPSEFFAACNGIYLDIFKIKSELNWEHTHCIKLTDLIPTMSRRITCKMMMDAIGNNKFMWLEDGGLCCTVWDLHEGCNVSYLFSGPDTRLGRPFFRGDSTMSISPDESMVAITSADGTLTTFYANTGIAISTRKFPGHKIEYVAFNGQNNQLFVITWDSTTHKLVSRILDPIQLDSGIRVNQVPVPIIGRTIHAFFRDESHSHKGLVCEADGSKIHCYVTQESADKTGTGGEELVDPSDPSRTLYPTPKSAQLAGDEDAVDGPQAGGSGAARGQTNRRTENGLQEEKQYGIRTTTRRRLFHDGDSSICWVLSVDVVENPNRTDEKIVFSFVPEPWMRIPAAAARQPEKLLKAYFLPGQRRFVVTGVQTLQIWSLPTDGSSDFNLVYIWSRPKIKDDDWAVAKKYQYPSELVGEYYHCIWNQEVYLNHDGENARAKVSLVGGFKMDIVNIPCERNGDTRSVFVDCARSIHLLSAAYAYSVQNEKRPKGHTFKEHAEAIARFTLSHVNRKLPSKSFFPSLPGDAQGNVTETANEAQELNRNTPAPAVPMRPRVPHITRVMSLWYLNRSSSFPKAPNHGSSGKRSSLLGQPTVTNQGNRVLSTNSDIELKLQYILPNFARWILPDKTVETLISVWSSNLEDTRSQDDISVLTLLLDQSDLQGANHAFIEGLFEKADHEWVPHANMALNPIKRVMDISNERLLKVLIDYCIRNAKTHHPVFLTPVIQCLSGITEWYPDILCDLFLRASYIPVHNPEYVASHAIIANLRSSDFLTFLIRFFGIFKGGSAGFSKPSNINQYKAPVFSVRSQLPLYRSTGVRSYFGRRSTYFPCKQIQERDAPIVVKRARSIYVSPFQFKPINGQRNRSFLSQIAGRDIFDSPAIVASLCYKW